MKLSAISFAIFAASLASPVEKRQTSTTWQYKCNSGSTTIAPTNFKAFDLGGCTAQLSFDKDRYVGVQWNFDAVYADGSRVEHTPFRDFDNFGVSDTFYPYLGNNFLTKLPGNGAFTAVHEFSNVCKGGQTPVAWVFRTSTGGACGPSSSYRFTTGQIKAVGGVSRPSKVTGTALRRVDANGNFEVTWNPVNRAAAYSVIVKYPSGTDELGRPYTNVRGERIQSGTTRATVLTGTRHQDYARQAVVHAVDSQGVWSFTSDIQPVSSTY